MTTPVTRTGGADLLLRGGRVIDPATATDQSADLALHGGRLVALAAGITAPPAARVLDCRGLYVVPGLIDLHTHVFTDGMEGAIPADVAGLGAGVSTVVDAGSAGAETIGRFLAGEYRSATTRIVVFMNLARRGLENPPEIRTPADLDLEATIAAIGEYREHVAGVKVRVVAPALQALGLDLVRHAKTAAAAHGLPVMVHLGEPGAAPCAAVAPQVVDLLEPGDILTHALSGHPGALTSGADTVASARAAQRRGVVLDLGHGVRNFSFQAAESLLAAGLLPDTVSTDMAKRPRRGPAYSITETMTKLLLLGIPLTTVIAMATAAPAAALGRSDLGHLRVGSQVDITLLREVPGPWHLRDSMGEQRTARLGLVPVAAIHAGRLFMPDRGPHPTGWLAPTEPAPTAGRREG